MYIIYTHIGISFKDVGLYQSPDNQKMKQESFTVGSAKVKSTQNYVHRKLRLAPIDKVIPHV